MRVELHGMTYDVCHFVVTSVVHTLHRVQNAALHWLQSVLDMWYSTLQDYIRGIVQEPTLVHTAQVMNGSSVESVHGLVVRVSFGTVVQHCAFLFL